MNLQRNYVMRRFFGLLCLLSACTTESPGNGGASNFVTCTSDEDCPTGTCGARHLCVEPSSEARADAGKRDLPSTDAVEPEAGPSAMPVEPEPPTQDPVQDAGPPSPRPVCVGHFDIQDQAELDELLGCQSIEGNLVLEPAEGVELDLEPLSTLESVDGFVIVGLNQWSTFDSLEGLRSLASVGSLSVTNTRVQTLEGLRSLERITGTAGEAESAILDLSGNVNLTDLTGLSNLREFDVLYLLQNTGLESLDGLVIPEKLERVSLVGLESLTQVSALAPLRDLGSLHVARLESLGTLDALGNLERLSAMTLLGNPALVHLTAMPGVTTVDTVNLESNAVLEALDFFPSVKSLGTLRVMANDSLSSVDFPELVELSSLTVVKNRELPPELVDALIARTSPGESKAAGNLGQTELLSPCPWANDGTCDEPNGLDICEVGTDPECVCTFECGE